MPKKYGSIEECVEDNLSFDEVAAPAITMLADLNYAKKAEPSLKKVIKVCGTFLGASPTIKDAEQKVDWKAVYDNKIEAVLTEFREKAKKLGLAQDGLYGQALERPPVFIKVVDDYGAYGWNAPNGERIFGDGNS